MLTQKQKNRGKGGYTFFEVMVTTAILATGIVMIYRSLILSLDYQNHLVNRLYALNLINNKIESVQNLYQDKGELPKIEGAESLEVTLNNQPVVFQFNVDFKNVGHLESIVQLDIVLSWSENNRLIRLTRSAYISKISS